MPQVRAKRRPVKEDAGAEWRNVPGFLFLNSEIVEEVRQLSGAGGKGTVDELGFQTLYDRIAERLFPWCSTLTSRARYFFFSLAVLDLAFSETVSDGDVNPVAEPTELARIAEQKRRALMRVVKRLERALALSLFAKFAAEERGIFGRLRCQRWFRDDCKVKGQTKILSADARYPNAIYRGGCRALGMFQPKDSSTTGLLRARVAGMPLFDVDWHSHSRIALATVRQLDEFWRSAEDHDMTFRQARAQIEKLPAFKTFIGFELTTDEANFLYGRIQRASPYLVDLDVSELPQLIAGQNLDLLKLKDAVGDSSRHELFDAAYHIDAVTAPFRAVYQQCSRSRSAAAQTKLNTTQIEVSKQWLDATSKCSQLEWAPIWRGEISELIADWISSVNADGSPLALLDRLCERAEQVVRSRGVSKKAPHERNGEDEDDLKAELDVVETSFRLGNGARILGDIAQVVTPE